MSKRSGRMGMREMKKKDHNRPPLLNLLLAGVARLPKLGVCWFQEYCWRPVRCELNPEGPM